MIKKPTHLSLFTGIGGIDLAAEWAGFESVGQVEFADYPTKILEKHWPDVQRWRDIRTVTRGSFYAKTGLYTVDLISGGFPCQPFSVAGKQEGQSDERYLWPEMLRIIRELKPTWVLGENVPGIIKLAGRTVCEDLEREGYAVAVFNFEAAAVGAPHRRERVFFVGHTQCGGQCGQSRRRSGTKPENGYTLIPNKSCTCNMGNSASERRGKKRKDCKRPKKWTPGASFISDCSDNKLQGCEITGSAKTLSQKTKQQFSGYGGRDRWKADRWGNLWTVEPDVGRVAHGVPARVDRLKCLGNAVVPQQVYPILRGIAEIEMEVNP